MSQQITSTLEALTQSTLRIREGLERRRQEEVELERLQNKRSRRYNLTERKPVNERLQEACVGVLALCEIGKSPELQTLIAEAGGPHRVWGGSEDLGARFVVSANILLGSDALTIKCDTTKIRIPYDLADPLIIRQTLQKIATPRLPHTIFFGVGKQDLSAVLTDEVIFEELVNYADPSYLERRFAVGPSPFLLIVDDELEDWRETEE